MITAWVSDAFLIAGTMFLLLGSIGLIRLPDFYTRAHAATKPDTLGLILVLLGLAVRQGADLNSAKLILVTFIVAIANPAAAHALGRSALRARLEPGISDERAEQVDAGDAEAERSEREPS